MSSLRWRIALASGLLVLLVVPAAVGFGLTLGRGAATVAGPLPSAVGIGTIIMAVCAAALALVASFLLTGSLTDRLTELRLAATGLSSGKPLPRALLEGGDEISYLSAALDQVADQMQSTISALENERNAMAAVLANLADGIVICNRDTRVTLLNRAAERLLGTREGWAAGQRFTEVVRDHEVVAVLMQCLEARQQNSGIVESGPGRRVLRVVATPLADGRGSTLVLLQDLTELRRGETVRRELVANVSHELRTPIASLKAIVETLEGGAIHEPEAAVRILDRMHTEVDGLTQVVRELLELSRVESGQSPLALADESTAEILREAVERLRPQADRAGVVLEVAVPADLPAVRVDRDRIQQVVVNLVHNAIKFTPSGGQVRVWADLAGSEVTVRISDTGVGINQDDLPRIFERFYEVDKSRSSGGTGLGLAIAKHVIQAHGSRIWVDSAPGQGTTFSFTLPVAGRGEEVPNPGPRLSPD